MTESARQAAARVTAATLTLLAREMEGLPPPYRLWSEPLRADEIREVALEVAAGKAAGIWVEEHHPARGLAIVRPMALESALLGMGSLRLTGPWMVEYDPLERRLAAKIIAAKTKSLPAAGAKKFLSVKTWEDSAVIRGFVDEGFQVAQFSARFLGQMDPARIPEFPFLYHKGLSIEVPQPHERADWLDSLGPLFYDGHHSHGPYLPADLSTRLWREVAMRDLGRGDPALFLWDERQSRPVGLAMAQWSGAEANLTILHVSEDRRGQGLGKLLICELFRRLVALGAEFLSVETASWNLPALRLYQSLGFKPRAPLAILHLET